MNEKLKSYIETIFKDVPASTRANELKEEILVNLNEKYNDLLEGHDPDAAYQMVIEGIGDKAELISFLHDSGDSAPGDTKTDIVQDNDARIKTINIDVSCLDVIIKTGGGDQISASVLTKRMNRQPKSRIVTEQIGDTFVIRQERKPWFTLLPLFEYLEVRLPADYQNNLEINSTAGNIALALSARLDRFIINATSGNIKMNCLSCGNYDILNHSGNIKAGELKGSGEIRCTSGNIVIESLAGASHKVSLTSGNFKAGSLCGQADIGLFSGTVKVASFRGEGSFKVTSGNLRIHIDELSGDCRLQAKSGVIDAGIDSAQAFKFESDCLSGNIRTNFEMMYNFKGTHATGQMGVNPLKTIYASVTSGNIGLYTK